MRSLAQLIATLGAALVLGAAPAMAQGQRVRSFYDLVCARYGICTPGNMVEADFTVGTSATQVTKQNAARVEVIITNNSSNTCDHSTSDQVTTTTGTQIPSNATVVLQWNEDFDAVVVPQWVVCSAAGSAIHVREIVLH